MASRSRLDTLLRVRRIEEDRAKAALAAARAEQRRAEARVAAAGETYRAIADGGAREPGSGAALTSFRHQVSLAAAAAKSLRHAGIEQEERSATTEQALDEVRVAAMRSEGLQRLVDRAAQEREQEILAADQRTAEESMAGKKARGRR